MRVYAYGPEQGHADTTTRTGAKWIRSLKECGFAAPDISLSRAIALHLMIAEYPDVEPLAEDEPTQLETPTIKETIMPTPSNPILAKIKELKAAGRSLASVARTIGCNPATFSNCVHGRGTLPEDKVSALLALTAEDVPTRGKAKEVNAKEREREVVKATLGKELKARVKKAKDQPAHKTAPLTLTEAETPAPPLLAVSNPALARLRHEIARQEQDLAAMRRIEARWVAEEGAR